MDIFRETLKFDDATIHIHAHDYGDILVMFDDFKGGKGRVHCSFNLRDIPDAFNFYRALGRILDSVQPGLATAVSDDDPSLVDALMVIHEADFRIGSAHAH